MASAFLLFIYWDRGWIPHDDGTLAHSAERVLQGEIPHRDFEDPYSGGLSALNALAFTLFGVHLAAMRWVLVAFTLACVPATFYVASRFTGYAGAAAIAFASVVWSVASYPAALPSWYNLFFALLGTAALVRHIETNRSRWLVLAGIFAGLSIAFKTAGLYFVSAALLLLLFREQALSERSSQHRETLSGAYSTFIVISLAAFALSLFLLIRAHPGSAQLFQFVMPGTVLAAFLASREVQSRAASIRRAATLARLVLPFLGGVAVVLVPWLTIYLLTGAVDDLIDGLFVSPLRRITYAAYPPVRLDAVLGTVPLLLIVAVGAYGRQLARVNYFLVLVAVAVAVLWASAVSPGAYRFVWYSLLTLIPVTVIAGTALLARATQTNEAASHSAPVAPHDSQRAQNVMLLLAVCAMTSLVQYPFSASIYFCYVAPLALLAAVAVCSLLPRPPRVVLAFVLGFYTAFGLLFVNPGVTYTTRLTRIRGAVFEALTLERGGISVPPRHKAEYEQLVSFLRAHASSGYVYAGPDSPEVYFLSGLRNPTRTLFDFFDEDPHRVARTIAAIERHDVSVLALNQRPHFSGRLPDDLTQHLREAFPNSSTIGRFEVRWR